MTTHPTPPPLELPAGTLAVLVITVDGAEIAIDDAITQDQAKALVLRTADAYREHMPPTPAAIAWADQALHDVHAKEVDE